VTDGNWVKTLAPPRAAVLPVLDLSDRGVPSAPGVTAKTKKSRIWMWFLVFEAVVALIYFPFGIPSGKPRMLGFIPWMEWDGQVPAWAVLGLSSVAAIAYGARRYRPRAKLAWWFIGAGVTLFISGDTIYKTWHQIMGQQNIPFPSFIDAIYITMYPVLAVGLLLLVRARLPGGDKAGLLDALIVTLGLALLSWIFLIGPNVRAPGGMLVRLTAAAYPLGDVLLLAMLAHLWSAGGLRNPAGRLLAIGTLGTLVADSVYGLAGLHSSWNWHDGNPFDLGWIVFYSCWGAAALHPSMRQLSERRPVAALLTSRSRLALLGAITLIAPVGLLVETSVGKPVDAPVIAAVAGIMFFLVVLRMSGVVSAHKQAVAREQVMRREAAELVGATGRTGINEATVRAVSDLVGGHAEAYSVSLALAGAPGEFKVVAARGTPDRNPQFDLGTLANEAWEALNAGRAVRCRAAVPEDVPAGTVGEWLFLCPIVTGEKLKGVIVVGPPTSCPSTSPTRWRPWPPRSAWPSTART